WGTYNRHPNFYEIFGDGGTIRPNTNLMSAWDLAGKGAWENGTQFDFGVNWRGDAAGAKADISLTWFQRDSKDLLVLSVPPMEGTTASYLALDGAKVHGLEMGANFNWKRVNLNLNATWQKSRYNGVNYYLRHNPPLTYTPEWVVSARVDYTLPGDKLNLFAEYYYVDEQDVYYQNGNYRHYLDSVGTVNLGLKYSFGKGFKLSLGVNDVFDKGPEQRFRISGSVAPDGFSALYPLPGRMYYATMEYKF
ncbi:MAG: TonB-dependent receptor, partial [Acidaminococcales bacterium]|nr:TonB-dependent receptor [Acidaminococcales bacterium]